MINVFLSPGEVLNACAAYFVKTAAEAITKQGKFSVALSGGSSPKGLYELLASDSFRTRVEWSKVYFFFGDERYVPSDHPDSNALMAKKALFDPLTIAAEQVFAVNTALSPKEAADDYWQQVKKYFGTDNVQFDLVLLGLGDNSHTASLFPGTDVLTVKEAGVKEVFLDDQKVYRITLTAPLINNAIHIAFLVYGSGKAGAVHHILEDAEDYNEYPAQLVKPVSGEVVWFLDEAASAKLKST